MDNDVSFIIVAMSVQSETGAGSIGAAEQKIIAGRCLELNGFCMQFLGGFKLILATEDIMPMEESDIIVILHLCRDISIAFINCTFYHIRIIPVLQCIYQ